ncbi:hypothetical protein KH5_15620 [Urechidicola sp. KH5]
MNKSTLQLLVLVLLVYQVAQSQSINAFQPYNTQGDNMMHICTADFDGVGKKDFIVGMTTNGKVIAFNRPDLISNPASDNRLWEYQPPTSIGIRVITGEVISSSTGDEVLVPGTDGHLRILSSQGNLLLDIEVSTGALYSATVGIGAGGQPIIATSGVDGLVYFFDNTGNELSTFRPKTKKPQGVAGVIRHVVAGDFDGNGVDEVISFVNNRNFRGHCFFDLTDLSTFQRPSYWNGITSFNEDDVANGMGYTDKQAPHAFDMDGDGDDELVGHWGVLHPEDGPNTQLLSTMLSSNEKISLSTYANYAQQYLIANNGFRAGDKEKLTNTGKYLMQHGIPGDFDNDGKPELFTVYGDDLFISDYEPPTKALNISDYSWVHSDYHFSDAARLESRTGAADKLVITGPINGDDHFYVIDITDSNWRTDGRIIDNQGTFGEINQNLDNLSNAIDNFTGNSATAADEPISFIHYFASWLGWEMTPANCAIRAQGVLDAQQDWLDKIGGQVNYDPTRIRMVAEISATVFGVSSDGTDPDITPEGMVEYCRALAQRGVYFSLKIGHGSRQYITPENLADCFEASVVDGVNYMMTRTRELSHHSYFDTYIPHMDALLDRATTIGAIPPKVMMCAKGAMFSTWTQQQTDEYFPKYTEMIVPGVENSNVNVQDWSIAERVGMWMNGDVKDWGCNIIGDDLTPNRVAEWGGMRNAHVILRKMLNAYALGARYFRVTSVTSKENPLFVRGDVTNPDLEWTQAYEKGFLNFLKIAENGLYPNALSVDKIKGISPVSVALYNRVDRLTEQSIKHDYYLYYPSNPNNVLGQFSCWNAYENVSETDVSSYIWGAKRRFDNIMPTSPGGFVTIIPNRSSSEVLDNDWCNKSYQTNGDSWVSGGKSQIVLDLLTERQNLDFFVDGECVWQVAQDKDDPFTYFVFLTGNNVLSPIQRSVRLKLGNNLSGISTVFDQLNGGGSIGVLSSTDDEVLITIPKGTARFLRIQVQESLSVNESEQKFMAVYPNPSSESFTIDLIDNTNKTTISIYNSLGTLINQDIITTSKKVINVHSWASGIYFVKAQVKDNFQTIKIVVN